ncbi:MAG: IS200/IS605 family transposase [Opitutaceae bacterium]|jgi:REP element-mobilizing transposase RayT|nr:IS200/IS605 family transposase [Opitutaceae bacterium]
MFTGKGYHLVCPAKYRRVVMSKKVDEILRGTCLEIEKRWEIVFLEIGMEIPDTSGMDGDQAHFLMQSMPTYNPSQIVRTVKSLIEREVFEKVPEVKKMLWGGEFWGKGYFINTVGQHGGEEVIVAYVENQGRGNYQQLHKGQMNLDLF